MTDSTFSQARTTNNPLDGVQDSDIVGASRGSTDIGMSIGEIVKRANLKSVLMDSTILRDRELMDTPPTITESATSTMAANFITYEVGYETPRDKFEVVAARQTPGVDPGNRYRGDNITTSFDLTTKAFSTARVIFAHIGRILELRFTGSTGIFFIKVDGKFHSLTPFSKTAEFIKIDFLSSDTRRVEIIAAGGNTASFNFRSVAIEHQDGMTKAIVKGPTTVIMTDSFGLNPRGFVSAFADGIGWDDVMGSGVSGTGFVSTSNGNGPNFGMRLQTDVIDLAPQVVGFVGSVNDNTAGFTAIKDAVIDVISRVKAALPNALIFICHTTSGGVDKEDTLGCRNRQAKKEAALESGVLWLDPSEEKNTFITVPTLTVGNAVIGATTITLDRVWGSNSSLGLAGTTFRFGDAATNSEERRMIISIAQASGNNTDITFEKALTVDVNAGAVATQIGGSFLTGIGYANAPTGYGNSDTLISDGTHPSDLGGDVLGYAIAKELTREIQLATAD